MNDMRKLRQFTRDDWSMFGGASGASHLNKPLIGATENFIVVVSGHTVEVHGDDFESQKFITMQDAKNAAKLLLKVLP